MSSRRDAQHFRISMNSRTTTRLWSIVFPRLQEIAHRSAIDLLLQARLLQQARIFDDGIAGRDDMRINPMQVADEVDKNRALDGYWEAHINIWDVAAGLCIVREAG